LVKKCPKCYALATTGRPLSEGGDGHTVNDACFGHRRDELAGIDPETAHKFVSFVPKEFIDAVGEDLDELRGRPARKYKSEVPDAALKQCESSHTAADGSRTKAGGHKHADKGLCAIVCRHDVPLFYCNIDTPGEQQKYALGLLIWLMLHLPDNFTMMNLYDIGCVADKVVKSYEIMPPSLESRIMFATSAMHAYAHEWECQLVFSPRLKPGAGLTDGEGVERLWSKLRKLIGILRHCSKNRRLVLLDRHMEWIAETMLPEHGSRLLSKWQDLVAREEAARKTVRASGRSAEFLRAQWEIQRETQLEVR
ncbi:hypothetical protein AURDEDRAFT_30569, partial [Auricularia subglabra TFB-10046 SS5]